MTKEKNEMLKQVIGRYDMYYCSVNNKGSLYLSINTFILGGVLTGFFALSTKSNFGAGINLLFIFTLIANLGAIICTLLAINPYVNKKKDNSIGSLLFFGDVAEYHEKPYNKMWDELDENKWYDDQKKQAQLLAHGLTKKFKKLTCATWFIVAQVILVVVFGIIILSKF